MLAPGLASNMAIEILGEVDTRSDGDTRARRRDAHFAIYGVPLRSTEPGEDCLEGRFLLWLERQ